MLAVSIAAIVIALVLLTALNAPARRARSNFNSADALIMQAESAMLRGRLDEAFACYQQAVIPARQSRNGVLEAEAFYGMARIHIQRGNKPSARRALDLALANREAWESYKPNFAALIERTARELDDNQAG